MFVFITLIHKIQVLFVVVFYLGLVRCDFGKGLFMQEDNVANVIFYFFIKVVFKIFTVDVWLDRIEYIKIGFNQLKAN